MTVLSRYIGRFVFGAIILVLMVLLAIDVVGAVIDGADDIRNDYRFADVLIHVGLTLPARIYENIAFASLIGCLVGLGVLAGNSELVVMRAAGVSLLRITAFVSAPVLVVIISGVVLGSYVVPYTDQFADSRRTLLRGARDNLATTSGVWQREGNEFVHINAVYPNGRLYGVTRYRFGTEHNIQEVSFAAQATYLDGKWLEERGRVTRFTDTGTEVDQFVTRNWDSRLSPDLVQLVSMAPDSLPLATLSEYASYLDDHGQKSATYWLAFWTKALQPIKVLSLVLIAVSFVLGPLREATMGFRIFAGVVTGIVFQTSQQMLGPSSVVFGFSPFWAVMAPALVCILIGLALLRRAS